MRRAQKKALQLERLQKEVEKIEKDCKEGKTSCSSGSSCAPGVRTISPDDELNWGE
jgi:hypothetical protein